jgi:hypothetical protein
MARITALETVDVRFPTSRALDGSDAMHPDPDYSALLADMTPEQVVALVDFRHISDALAPDEALDLLCDREPGKAARERALLVDGLPAYTTSAGWLGGVNEVIAVLLLAAKHGVPVCPHAGGVGLCELVQHLAAFDFVAVGGSLDGRVVEYVDHLHEHFVDPCVVLRGRYRAPTAPGYSAEMHSESLARYAFPTG